MVMFEKTTFCAYNNQFNHGSSWTLRNSTFIHYICGFLPLYFDNGLRKTTPLMSSESPAPTRDQQEHTSRTTTPDATMDGDDQSLGPEDDVIWRDSQSTPSTSSSQYSLSTTHSAYRAVPDSFLLPGCNGLGLKAKKSCSSTSDAVCEVLDEFFCSDSNRAAELLHPSAFSPDSEDVMEEDGGVESEGNEGYSKGRSRTAFCSPGQPPERLCTSVGLKHPAPGRRPPGTSCSLGAVPLGPPAPRAPSPWDLLLPGRRPPGTSCSLGDAQLEGTFQDGDNGREQCFACKLCDAGLGLKVKRPCTPTSDAVCEVLDGFFCSDSNRGGRMAAQRHTVCSPGQYIGQRGTADKDTECLHCTDGTFSNGTSTSCQNHTKCESVGLKLMKPGTDSTDSECGGHGPHAGLVAGVVISGVILVMALMGLIIAIIHRKKIREWRLTSKMETLSQELSRDYRLRGIYSPAPTGDQQEHPTTNPAATMDDHDGDQSLGPAPPPPQVPHNGSVLIPQHPEDNQTVLFRTDGGQDLCPPHSGSPLPLPVHPPQSGSPSPSRSTPLSLGPPSPSRPTPLTLVPPSPSQSTPLSLGSRDGNEPPPHAICPWICLVAGELCHFTRHCVG
ncbi:unnamed protein product [Gadus morhua 'NCC']